MIFDVEVLLKGEKDAVVQTVSYDGPAPAAWTDQDVSAILRAILLTLDQVKNPEAAERTVALRGLSWIVTPFGDGVMIAIEIPSGAVVAGPFEIDQRRLTDMIARVLKIAGAGEAPPVH